MPTSLFLVMLGPVQEFIAGARRTRDLWFGSWMLSELSHTAAKSVQRHGGTVTPIFPPPSLLSSSGSTFANVANKILARVSADPEMIGLEVIKEVNYRLQTMWLRDARSRFSGIINDAVALAQITDLLEIYWAAVDLPSDAAYPLARKQVEGIMAARKATRDFKQVTWGATLPKSSIDGQRESVIAEEQYALPGSTPDQRKAKAEELYNQYKAGPAERLSGVDLLKRHGRPSQNTLYFPSTSDVAVRPILKRIEGLDLTKAKSDWDRYLAVIESLAAGRLREERVDRHHPVIGSYDGGLLLESRLYELLDERADREQAHRALADFYKALGLPRPEPYYAILLADGDRMGATINHHPKQDEQPDAKIDPQRAIMRHLELSRRLGEFAASAQTIVNAHEGALIYAGGDDVLAFVPLHTLLNCAKTLHARFGAMINPEGGATFADGENKTPTLSVGIAICHQIEPLSDALELARAAEKAAKHVYGKDALAITLSKRSGADVTICGKWDEIDVDLAAFVMLHRIDALPDGAAFQFRDLAERLKPKRSTPTLPAEATLSEAKRIIGRKQPKHGVEEQLASDTRAHIDTALARLPVISPPNPQEDAETTKRKQALARVRALADALIIARILATAADVAEPLTKESPDANLVH